MKIEIAPNEKLIRQGAANLQRGVETVGGRLCLTDSRLVFSSHKFNVQTGCTEIPLSAIDTVRPCWTKFLGIFPLAPNSLAVNAGSMEYRFVLFDRASWAQSIQLAVSGLSAYQFVYGLPRQILAARCCEALASRHVILHFPSC